MDDIFNELRAKEFSRLDRLGHVYLDYTGAGLYAESHIRYYSDLLLNHVWGNPHSFSPTSLESTKRVDEARERIQEFFGANDYDVIFTLNATNALKLVGESYPFGSNQHFLLTADNHNSVNGIRESARSKHARVHYIPLNSDLRIDSIENYLSEFGSRSCLFAYPAQSNFSGVKHPLEWIELAHRFGFDTLLDAAAYVPTNPLNLKQSKADFVPISFYKMFGFPSGIGALLVKTEFLKKLSRPWFSGGTIRYVSTTNRVHLLVNGSQGYEDGTIDFLGIIALSKGLDLLETIGMGRISKHVLDLTMLLLDELRDLRHSSGEPLVKLYGPKTMENRGGTVAFNLLDEKERKLIHRKLRIRPL